MKKGYAHGTLQKVHAVISPVKDSQRTVLFFVKKTAPAVEHLFFPVAAVRHHAISRLGQRHPFLHGRGDFPFQESAFFRPVHPDFHLDFRSLCRQAVADACLGMAVFHDRFHHPFHRPVLHNAHAGNPAARRAVAFIGGTGVTASFLFPHQAEPPQFFPVAVPVHSPGVAIRFHHHQPAGAFP